jgi:hypothetical protein
MSTARQELYDLAEKTEQETPPENLTKKDVSEAITGYFEKQKKSQEEAELADRQRKLEEQQQKESQELAEISQVVKKSLQDQIAKDKDFAALVEKSDLPSGLIDYIAEIGEPEEAYPIVKELANNEEYKQKLKNTQTEMGVKKLLKKVRAAVIVGGGSRGVPEIMKKDIPHYNYNNSPSDYDQNYYSDLGMRHGI